MSASKRLLLLMRRAPYVSSHAEQAAEIALVAGALGLPIALLFQGPGIWQLLSRQHGAAVGAPTLTDLLEQLPDYDVNDIYACSDAMARFGLGLDDLILPVRLLDPSAQGELIAACHVVLND